MGAMRTRLMVVDSAPTFSDIDMPLSLNTTSMPARMCPAWFSPPLRPPGVSAPAPPPAATVFAPPGAAPPSRHAQRGRHRRAGVAGAELVVRALGAVGKSGQPA